MKTKITIDPKTRKFNSLIETLDLATMTTTPDGTRKPAFDDVSNVRALVEIARNRGLWVLAGELQKFIP
jgi:hypothetical protein